MSLDQKRVKMRAQRHSTVMGYESLQDALPPFFQCTSPFRATYTKIGNTVTVSVVPVLDNTLDSRGIIRKATAGRCHTDSACLPRRCAHSNHQTTIRYGLCTRYGL